MPLALRLTLIVLLAGLLVWPPLARLPGPQALQVRRDNSPPSIEELERLEQRGGPLYAALPSAQPALVVTPPSGARRSRAASIDWKLRAEVGSAGIMRISDAAGPLNSALVSTDATGVASGAFRVLPADSGWQEWTLAWEGLATSAGAWVLPERPLRALVASGPASLEGRDVARALEARGVEVTLAQALGRGLAIGDSPAGLPSDADALDPYDVVLVLADVALTNGQASALTAFASRGGGVLAAGSGGASLPIARGTSSSRVQIPASTIEWTTPAEIPPLPAAEVEPTAVSLEPAGPITRVTARSGTVNVLLLASLGRGRMAALALEDTWIWGLRAGRGAELASFWRGLSDWLAGGSRAPYATSVDPTRASPGSTVSVAVQQLDSTVARPTSVMLTRPAEISERLPLAWVGPVGHGRFVSNGSGPFVVGASAVAAGTESLEPSSDLDDAALSRLFVPVAHAADTGGDSPADSWARLALLANASGGGAVPADSLDGTLGRLPPSRVWPLPPLVWLAIALVFALTEWTARRLRGLA